MALPRGSKIGPYEILSPLGAGGMGEVYRARDTKLNRDVALKVLPEAFAADPQRMARFEREAQVLASLNHPNIAAIYGLEESDSTRALVMELVEGETLAERIHVGEGSALPQREPKGLPYDDALQIAKQVAEALEYAHERGIVHRDLKPANIKITPEGTVKVLDFGLAKAMGPDEISRDASNSPTLSIAATQAGFILGTAAYMAPEQAKAKPVDRRCDIWAFGCVLFEMLSGKKTFEGETVSDVLAAVIMKDPDWSALPQATPPSIQRLIRRCLIKDLKQRLQAIGEARITIEETLSGAPSPLGPLPQAGGSGPEGRVRVLPQHRILPWAVAFVAVMISLALGWRMLTQPRGSNLSWTGETLGGPSVAMGPRISPDGHTLAFQAFVNGLTQVAVMDTDSGDWTVLTKDRTRGYVRELNWSPDGSRIYFDRAFAVPHGIYSVSRFGGDERLVLSDAMEPEVLPDGSLLVMRLNQDREDQLYHFWPESGRIESLDAVFPPGDTGSLVRVFHDGKDAVFFGMSLDQKKSDPERHLYIENLSSGQTQRLAPDLDLQPTTEFGTIPLAIGSDDRDVLTVDKAGDLDRIISIPRSGNEPARTLFSVTMRPVFMDVDNRGYLYFDQIDRPQEAIRFSAAGGTPDLVAGPMAPFLTLGEMFQLADGRILLDSMVEGKSRILVKQPGGEAVPFVQTQEETSVPACPVGSSDFAFILGSQGNEVLAEASLSDGHIVRRFDGIPAGDLRDIAASPDGKTLYYISNRILWAVAASGGQPKQIAPGDSVAADPNGKDLIVQLVEKSGVRLVQLPVAGGPAKPIPIPGPNLLTEIPLNPLAVAKDDRILATFASGDSWFYSAGIIDPRTGKLQIVPTRFTGDVLMSGWQADGRILSGGWPMNSTLWRFRPQSSKLH